jgi:hypothetical protein
MKLWRCQELFSRSVQPARRLEAQDVELERRQWLEAQRQEPGVTDRPEVFVEKYRA